MNPVPRNSRAALKLAACFSSGLMLFCSFPPYSGWELAWVAFVPVLVLAFYSKPGEAFRWGLLSGAVFWLSTLSWLLRLGLTGPSWALAVSGWVLLSLYCALYSGLFLYSVAWVARLAGRTMEPALIVVIPLLWVGFEYLRSSLFGGFPWNAVGISQYRNLPVIQVAEIMGVYGVSAVVMLMNAGLSVTATQLIEVYRSGRRRRLHVELMVSMAVVFACVTWGYIRRVEISKELSELNPVTVSAIQPNVPQLRSWYEDFDTEVYEKLEFCTKRVADTRPDLIVWPETALPYAMEGSGENGLFVDGFVHLEVPILVGALELVEVDGETRCHNASFLYGKDGSLEGIYRKRHLVPFGEYIPFEDSLEILRRFAPLGYSCLPGKKGRIFKLMAPHGEVRFSPLICFEDVFAYLCRRDVLAGSRLMVNQTNDAWFDGSSEHIQHMSHCVFRCVENRVPGIRATNTGVTCLIDREGSVEYVSPGDMARETMAWKTGVVLVPGHDMNLTFYTRHGDAPFALPAGILAGAIAAAGAIQGRRKRNQ